MPAGSWSAPAQSGPLGAQLSAGYRVNYPDLSRMWAQIAENKYRAQQQKQQEFDALMKGVGSTVGAGVDAYQSKSSAQAAQDYIMHKAEAEAAGGPGTFSSEMHHDLNRMSPKYRDAILTNSMEQAFKDPLDVEYKQAQINATNALAGQRENTYDDAAIKAAAKAEKDAAARWDQENQQIRSEADAAKGQLEATGIPDKERDLWTSGQNIYSGGIPQVQPAGKKNFVNVGGKEITEIPADQYLVKDSEGAWGLVPKSRLDPAGDFRKRYDEALARQSEHAGARPVVAETPQGHVQSGFGKQSFKGIEGHRRAALQAGEDPRCDAACREKIARDFQANTGQPLM